MCVNMCVYFVGCKKHSVLFTRRTVLCKSVQEQGPHAHCVTGKGEEFRSGIRISRTKEGVSRASAGLLILAGREYLKATN